jgi:hypothetical protein
MGRIGRVVGVGALTGLMMSPSTVSHVAGSFRMGKYVLVLGFFVGFP